MFGTVNVSPFRIAWELGQCVFMFGHEIYIFLSGGNWMSGTFLEILIVSSFEEYNVSRMNSILRLEKMNSTRVSCLLNILYYFNMNGISFEKLEEFGRKNVE